MPQDVQSLIDRIDTVIRATAPEHLHHENLLLLADLRRYLSCHTDPPVPWIVDYRALLVQSLNMVADYSVKVSASAIAEATERLAQVEQWLKDHEGGCYGTQNARG